jgi:adenylylsulfate kinase
MKGVTLWFTGPDPNLNTKIGEYLKEELKKKKMNVDLITEKEIKEKLCQGGKSEEWLSTKRLGYMSELLTRNELIVIAISEPSPREIRDQIRKKIGNFLEIEIKSSKESDLYESPYYPEVLILEDESKEKAIEKILSTLKQYGYIEDITSPYSKEDEEKIKERLEKLGYI